MLEALTIATSIAGGTAIPFIVGQFVQAGASLHGNRVPWMLENRTRLLAQSAYYFVALLIVVAAAAALVFVLPSFKWNAAWLFLVQAAPAALSYLVFRLARRMRNSDGRVFLAGKELTGAQPEYLGLLLIWVSMLGWVYITRALVERWTTSTGIPSEMDLWLAVLLLIPAALWTFSCTAQTWGILFAYQRYSYQPTALVLTDGHQLEGRLVRETDHDVRIVVGGTLHIIRWESVRTMTVQL